MRIGKRIGVGLCAASISVALMAAPATAANYDGGRELPPGTQVPFDPGPSTTWMWYDTVKMGEPGYFGGKQAIRMVGQFDGDHLLCMFNRGGTQGCYHKGQPVTRLGWTASGIVATTDPVAIRFAPLLHGLIRVIDQLQGLTSQSSRR